MTDSLKKLAEEMRREVAWDNPFPPNSEMIWAGRLVALRERLLEEAIELAKSNTHDAPDAWPYGRNVTALRSIAGEAEETE